MHPATSSHIFQFKATYMMKTKQSIPCDNIDIFNESGGNTP